MTLTLPFQGQWLFNMNQQVTETTTEGVKTLAFTWDQRHLKFQKSDRSISRISARLNQKIGITAKNLNTNQFETLRYLTRSDDIKVYLRKDGSRKADVVSVPDTMIWETKDRLLDLTFTIEFEPDFDFFQEKEY